jgi:hypothetical protein
VSGASEIPGVLEFADLVRALADATARLEKASERAAQASRDETSARNVVNEAQRALDRHMDVLRRAANRGTDWGQERRTGRCLPVEAGS